MPASGSRLRRWPLLQPLTALALLGASAISVAAGIEGRWQTVDLDSGEPRGEVSLRLVAGVLEGHISGGRLRPGETVDSVCTKCEGAKKNQRLLGMQVVWGMRAEGDERHYSGGRVLDTDSGGVYRASMTLSADGQTLAVRGYLGLPALGQTTTWKRLPPTQMAP